MFARELVDGVIYQTMPKPVEKIPDQQSFADAYQNCDKLLNSGFLMVYVTPSNVRVSYYRNYFVSSEPQAGKGMPRRVNNICRYMRQLVVEI